MQGDFGGPPDDTSEPVRLSPEELERFREHGYVTLKVLAHVCGYRPGHVYDGNPQLLCLITFIYTYISVRTGG